MCQALKVSFFGTDDQLREAFRDGLEHPSTPGRGLSDDEVAPLLDAYLKLARPAIGFFDRGHGEPSLLRGGDPRLPTDMVWPTGPTGLDLTFECEVRLSQLPESKLLADRDGSLLFFSDVHAARGKAAGYGLCIRIDPAVDREPRPHPPSMAELKDLVPRAPGTYWSEAGAMLPRTSADQVRDLAPDLAAEMAFEIIAEEVQRISTDRFGFLWAQMFGWAGGSAQPHEQLLAKTTRGEDWRSLLSVCDDIGYNSKWLVREPALVAGNFSECLYEWGE